MGTHRNEDEVEERMKGAHLLLRDKESSEASNLKEGQISGKWSINVASGHVNPFGSGIKSQRVGNFIHVIGGRTHTIWDIVKQAFDDS